MRPLTPQLVDQDGRPLGGGAPDREPAAIQLALDLLNGLDAPALLELAGGSEADINGLLDTILVEAHKLVAPPPQHGTAQIEHFTPSQFQELDKLASSLHEAALIQDINYFITSALPEFEMNWHCIEWGHMVMWYRLLCIQAARDHGKSYFFSFAYLLWKLWRYQRVSPTGAPAPLGLRLSEKGILFTNSMDLGKEFLEGIKTAIEEKPMLRERLFPRSRTAKWNTESIKCRNGARLDIKSYPAKRGPHPGYIVWDDLLDESQTYSADARLKMKNFFNRVMINMLVPHGQMIGVGTPLHRDDLYSEVKKMKQFRFLQYPAIFPDGRLLYENRHSFESLMQKKEDQGSLAFTQEQQCNPVSNDSTIFPDNILLSATLGMEGYVLVSNIYAHPVKFKAVVMGCDFAMSATVGADYSVFTTLGIDERDHLWLLNVHRSRGQSFASQMQTIRQLHADFKHDIIYMEANQAQVIYAQEADRHGLPVEASVTGTEKNGLIDGLPGLAIWFEQGKFHFPQGDEYSRDMVELIFSELKSMAFTDKGLKGVGAHDDCAMSLWKAGQAAKHPTFNFGFL